MPSSLDDDLFALVPSAFHFNVKHQGGALYNRVTARHFVATDPNTLEWVWIVEGKRLASPEEIVLLCAGKPLKI